MNEEGDAPLKQIRTFQGDIAEALKQKNETTISLVEREHAHTSEPVQAPQASTEISQPQVPPQPAPVAIPYDSTPAKESHLTKNLLLILGSIVLLGAGAYGAWYAYSQYEAKTALPVIALPANRFITPQKVFALNTSSLDRNSLISAIRTEASTNIAAGSITELELHEGEGQSAPLTTTEEFLVRYLETQAPNALLRSFDSLFMLGLLGNGSDSVAHGFIVIKLDSFQNAFPGMLNWEPTMAKDLLPVFASDQEIGNVSTSTSFADITIQNKDARILRDHNGSTVLLYSFFDNNYLIITDNEASLRQLVKIFNAQKLVR